MNDKRSRDWAALSPVWFRTANTDELREFVDALDNGWIKDKNKEVVLKEAFEKECNRRSAMDYSTRNNGEWI